MNREMKNNRHRMKSTYSYRVQPSCVLQITNPMVSLFVSVYGQSYLWKRQSTRNKLEPFYQHQSERDGKVTEGNPLPGLLHRFVHIASMQWYRIAVSHTEIQGQQPSR